MTASQQNNLPSGLLQSVCEIESGLNIKAIHHHDGKGDSLGICQIKLATAQMLGFKGTAKELMKPETNIAYAGLYLSRQLKRYNGDVDKALVAYNQGSTNGLTSSKYSIRVLKQYQRRILACGGSH